MRRGMDQSILSGRFFPRIFISSDNYLKRPSTLFLSNRDANIHHEGKSLTQIINMWQVSSTLKDE